MEGKTNGQPEYNEDGLRALVVGIIHQAVVDTQLLQRRGVIGTDLTVRKVPRNNQGRIDSEKISGIYPTPLAKDSNHVEVFARELVHFLVNDLDDLCVNGGIDLEPEAVRRGLRRKPPTFVNGMNNAHQRPERHMSEQGRMRRYGTTKGINMGKAPTQGVKRYV